jgi:ATP-binding cassette subfamily B protein
VQLKPDADKAEAGAEAPTGFSTVEVDRVSFTYPGSRRPALNDVSIRIDAGEIIALVGENGSGKTTLAKLLAVLYEADSGSIRWDGADIRGFDRAGLRRAIAIIFQDFIRYELTARENISAGRGGAGDDAAIAAAAHQAGADRFLEELPLGYDTILSKQFKGGRDLSLGQWQRVALARAFYRDAPFVILDEPSSALDPRAEHDLFARIRTLLAGRTVLFISHRFSTVRSADRIYVMGNGRIVEQGTHDELMAHGGSYAELFTLQAAAYLDRHHD